MELKKQEKGITDVEKQECDINKEMRTKVFQVNTHARKTIILINNDLIIKSKRTADPGLLAIYDDTMPGAFRSKEPH